MEGPPRGSWGEGSSPRSQCLPLYHASGKGASRRSWVRMRTLGGTISSPLFLSPPFLGPGSAWVHPSPACPGLKLPCSVLNHYFENTRVYLLPGHPCGPPACPTTTPSFPFPSSSRAPPPPPPGCRVQSHHGYTHPCPWSLSRHPYGASGLVPPTLTWMCSQQPQPIQQHNSIQQFQSGR